MGFASGIFTARDPFSGVATHPYSQHPYQYGHGNPISITDPSGKIAPFIAKLIQASIEGAVDALRQAVFAYYFDPTVSTPQQAVDKINWWQVGWAFLSSFVGGGKLVQSVIGAAGALIINWLQTIGTCDSYTIKDAIEDFATNFVIELIGSYAGELAVKYSSIAVAKGLRRLGLDDLARKFDGPDGPPKGGGGGGGCSINSFSAATDVATADGAKDIADIEVGDQVLAYNEETGETGLYTVTAVLVHEDSSIVHLTLDTLRLTDESELIETTPEHPFFTDQGWVDAGALQQGGRVRRADGSYGIVVRVTIEQRRQIMYNLSVDGAHTFFISDGLWLVHNSKWCNPDGPFAKNGVQATDHFYRDALNDPDDPIAEEEAWAAYTNGSTYENERGQIIKYNPITSVAVVIDPDTNVVITTFGNNGPPSPNWVLISH